MDKIYELRHIVKFDNRENPYSIRVQVTKHIRKNGTSKMYFGTVDIGKYKTREEAVKAMGEKTHLKEYNVESAEDWRVSL